MLNFFNNKTNLIEFKENIKIIECENIDLFLHDLFEYEQAKGVQSIDFDGKLYSIKDISVFTYLNKITDFLSLSPKNWLGNQIIQDEMWQNSNFFNNQEILSIIDKINTLLGFELLEYQIDNTKLLKSLFEINPNILLSKNNFAKIMEIVFANKPDPLVIFKDLEFINLIDLLQFTNTKFIILTTDFTKYINKYDQLELVGFYKDKTIIDIKTPLPIISYFENHKNKEILENQPLFSDLNEKNEFRFHINIIKRTFFE
ncbi:hypothetical protein Q4516_01235 [Mesomycoplasma ovipneumoniae]|uniref:hypothetical protein n=1 Tax=Mesomycoplasma ovipneumoniae TaxID=29562 RepID=UPI0026E41896|nr:hypothetical protein [Mesomycoplasma ovipneumoniae]MDO6825918.1 hypothetical protein [Mesomycoplasma ovipneumoniae]